MGTKLDNRKSLSELFKHLNEIDTQTLMSFAAGYEAGKISQMSESTSIQLKNQEKNNKTHTA